MQHSSNLKTSTLAINKLLPFSILMWKDYRAAKHVKLLAKKLEQVERGEIKNLAIFMPPRHGKSQLTSVFFPAWFIGKNPNRNVIFTSYAQSIASDFGYKVKMIMMDPTFEILFPEATVSDIAFSKNEMKTIAGGAYYAIGAGGPITSRGGDLIIIDDPIKGRAEANSETIRENIWQWYRSTLFTRKSPDARMVLIQTRWHDDDLAGKILKNERKEWEVIEFPAINENNEALWPEQWPMEKLNEIKTKIGTKEFSSLYQQKPVNEEASMFKRHWWKFYREVPLIRKTIQVWDCAHKVGISNDFSVCATWGMTDNGFYLIDLWRGKVEMPQLEVACQNQFAKYKPHAVIIEDKASGIGLIQSMRQKTTMPIIAYDPKMRDKEVRAAAATPSVEAGKCYLPVGVDWVEDFILEHELFPNTAHDDQVDTTSMALEYFNKHNRGSDGPRVRRL